MCISFLIIFGNQCFWFVFFSFLAMCLVETAGVLVRYFGWWIFLFSVWGSGGPKILLLIIEWVLDVLPDFGMGFLSQDLDFLGVDCNKMFGGKVASIILLGTPWHLGVNFPYFGTNGY
jgi:hypothetical protein